MKISGSRFIFSILIFTVFGIADSNYLVIINHGEYVRIIDIKGWNPGMEFVELNSFYYPWQGEDSLDYKEEGGYLFVNGKRIGVSVRHFDFDTLLNPEEIVTINFTYSPTESNIRALGRFLNLEAAHFYLKDNMPSIPFGEFQKLRFLSLSGRPLRVSELEEISGMNQLTVLRLFGLSLKGNEFEMISKNNNLRVLELPRRGISETELGHVSEMNNLTRLELCLFEISDSCIDLLVGLKNLEYLEVTSDTITEYALEVISNNFPNLKSLFIWSGPISGSGLRHLEVLDSLRYLRFIKSGGTNEGVKNLSGLKSLEELVFQRDEITDSGLIYLGEIDNLHKLVIDGKNLTDAGMVHLRMLPGLEELDIRTELSDEGVGYLKELKDLKRLVLSGKDITDASIPVLAGFSELVELNVTATGISEEGVEELRKLLPRCRVVKKVWRGDVIRINTNATISSEEILELDGIKLKKWRSEPEE